MLRGSEKITLKSEGGKWAFLLGLITGKSLKQLIQVLLWRKGKIWANRDSEERKFLYITENGKHLALSVAVLLGSIDVKRRGTMMKETVIKRSIL